MVQLVASKLTNDEFNMPNNFISCRLTRTNPNVYRVLNLSLFNAKVLCSSIVFWCMYVCMMYIYMNL